MPLTIPTLTLAERGRKWRSHNHVICVNLSRNICSKWRETSERYLEKSVKVGIYKQHSPESLRYGTRASRSREMRAMVLHGESEFSLKKKRGLYRKVGRVTSPQTFFLTVCCGLINPCGVKLINGYVVKSLDLRGAYIQYHIYNNSQQIYRIYQSRSRPFSSQPPLKFTFPNLLYPDHF